MTSTMGGAYVRTPQSIFQHMMSQQNTQQQQAGQWMQMPQVPPISIPWSIPALQQPEVIRFTGETSYGPIVHQKRKLEVLDRIDINRCTKQFITEEKMAAHFKDLHISGNGRSESSTSSTSTVDRSFSHKQSDMDLDVDTTNNTINTDQTNIHPRLVLSEELKRMQQEPILPSTLLSKLERPSMALVLWEPPSKHLRILPTRDTPTPIPMSNQHLSQWNYEDLQLIQQTSSTYIENRKI
ncbi:uncharacterized protein LOC105186752 isoform X3 [Harpegnathos saltator]|uniref:uncharacterized protein LOC105186752 isoform X3 n=1 Tax=Harpegnathos saltator TaxID=610380 RepID=UPI00058FF3C5|nr:uncharacterized protein LOC105186752 isoform X3 [Harpegnathos saltator]